MMLRISLLSDIDAGICGSDIATDRGWHGREITLDGNAYICICHRCTRPTFIDLDRQQTPSVIYGRPVDGIDDTMISAMYDEARKAIGCGSYTAAVLCCRKLLMHIAVKKGAIEGENFVSYVNYLSENHHVPVDEKDWVDHIRKKGNEANHQIVLMSQEDAENLIAFIEMLLKIMFEFPHRGKLKRTPSEAKK